MDEILKSELNQRVPKELSMNVDYWNQIKSNINNNYFYVPMGFIQYLSNRYSYDIALVNSLEVRQYIMGIALQINGDERLMNIFRSIIPTQKLYPVHQSTCLAGASQVLSKKTKYTRETIKDRKNLLKETPLADFDF